MSARSDTAVDGRSTPSTAFDAGQLAASFAPIVEEAGYELVAVELGSEQGSPVVRLFIDTVPPSFPVPAGKKPTEVGVLVDDCAFVSRRVSAWLDEEMEAGRDPLPGSYRLEVSSPGLFRPLTKPAHFVGAVGERVRVRTREKLEGRRVFVGTLVAAEEGILTVDVDGTRFAVPLDALARANLEPLLD